MTVTPEAQSIPGELLEISHDPMTLPAMEITARLTTHGGVRELSIAFRDVDAMPDDDQAVQMADDLSRRVWGDRSGLTQKPPQAEIRRNGQSSFLPRDRGRGGDRRRR
jgi:hypothetical protein